MNPLYRNILIGIMIALIFSLGGYFLYPKIHKTELKKGEPNTPTITEKDNNIDSTSVNKIETQTTNSKSKEQNTNTIKENKETPTPEPPIPIGTDRFIVSLSATNEDITTNLLEEKYITDKESFVNILNKDKNPVTPGAYKISTEMTPTQLDRVLHNSPYMKWVKIKPGLRKEEIADLLAETLGWSTKEKNDWITVDTTAKPDYIEGVYFPDTYLIPVDETGKEVANRLISKFNENFSYFLSKFTAKNIKWTTALTLASIVQREAANDADMPLIAGILWNRLNQNMYLDVDSTLQYVRGNTGSGWWAPISVADKKTDSPYNTYKYKGLPPHPIANPGVVAINAVLSPTKTDCLYYLHDRNHVTHCSKTYEEHQQNIQTYLISTQ